MTTDESRPHTAVLFLTIEVHEKLPSGEMGGIASHKEKKVLALDGADKHICMRKLNELIEELKKCCRLA